MVELATEDGSSLATAGAPPATAHATSRQRPMMTAATLANQCSSRHRFHRACVHEPVPTSVTTQCEAFAVPVGPMRRSVIRSSTGTSEDWPASVVTTVRPVTTTATWPEPDRNDGTGRVEHHRRSAVLRHPGLRPRQSAWHGQTRGQCGSLGCVALGVCRIGGVGGHDELLGHPLGCAVLPRHHRRGGRLVTRRESGVSCGPTPEIRATGRVGWGRVASIAPKTTSPIEMPIPRRDQVRRGPFQVSHTVASAWPGCCRTWPRPGATGWSGRWRRARPPARGPGPGGAWARAGSPTRSSP